METIIIMQIVVLLIVIAIIVFFIYRPLKNNNIDDNSANVAIAKQKLLELQSDLDNNLIKQENYQEAKLEIEQNLASELNESLAKEQKNPHLIAILVVIFSVFLSFIVYHNVKNTPPVVVSTQDNISTLKNYLAKNPTDAKSWQVLAFIYNLDKQIQNAKNAYQKSYQLGNKDIDLLTEYASTLATINDGDFSGLPSTLVKEALEIDKNSIKALYLAGIIAANAGIYELAEGLWNKALKLSETGSGDEAMLANVLQQLKDFMAGDNQEQASQTTTNTKVQINVVVDIPEDLYKQRFNDYIMIYAKNATGRPMPIAIEKTKLADFNGVIELSDSNSVMPTNKLSDAKNIVIVARISASGSAFKQSGDVDVVSNVIKSQSQTVELKF